MPPPEKFTTMVVVTECKAVHSGTNRNQQPYTLYQVQAVKAADMQPIPFNLRAFENLPLNTPVEVDAQFFSGNGQYPDSYTLKQKAKKGSSLGPRVGHLEKQMRAVMEKLGMPYEPAKTDDGQQQQPQAAAPAAAPPPPTQPAAPPPPPQPPAPPAPPAAPPAQAAPPPPVQPQPTAGQQFGDDPPF